MDSRVKSVRRSRGEFREARQIVAAIIKLRPVSEKKIYWNLTRQSLSHLAPYVQRQVREPACCLFLVR